MMYHRLTNWMVALSLLLFLAPVGKAQYILPYDTLDQEQEELEGDTIITDTLEVVEPEGQLDTNYVRPARTDADPDAMVVAKANLWIRRLLFRGWLDTSHIGAFARYQLTSWSPGIGSYGPIDARITVYYLGPTAWLGNDAEWLQVAVQTLNEEPTLIE